MSRFRSIAPAVGLVLVLAGCQPRPRLRRPCRIHSGSDAASASDAAPSEPRRHPPAPSRRRRASHGKFKGVNVNILTFNGPQVAEPLQRRAPDWESLTGGHVNVVAVGFQTIYDKALLDASTGTNAFDAYVFDPQWMGDFVGPGYLLDLTDRGERPIASSTGRTSARSSATSTRPTTARSTRSRSTATSTWSITASDLLDEGRRQAAGDLGRLPHDRPEVQRPGPQRRRPAGLRLVHRQEEGRPELLVDHLDRRPACSRARAPNEGAFFDTIEHEPAVRPERGDDQGPRDVHEDGDVRPARRAEHGRRRDAAACSRPAAAR